MGWWAFLWETFVAINAHDFIQLSTNTGMFRDDTNIGIALSGKNIYIIDTGSNETVGQDILLALTELFPQKNIAAILNTHSHADHCGGNGFLVEHTGCEVWASRNEAHLIEFPELQSALIWGGRPFKKISTSFYRAQTSGAVSHVFSGKPIALADIVIETVPLPGHYFDQVGILVHDKADQKQTFFLGDAIFGLSMIKRYWIPFMHDAPAFRKSLQLIADTPADFYVPSHGERYGAEDIHEIAEVNMLATIETELLIKKLLKRQSMTHEELLKAVSDYACIPMGVGQYILIGSTLRSYLSCLYDAHEVTFEVKENRMLWKLSAGSE